MAIKYIITIWIAKVSFLVLRIFKKGQGTALPGLVAEKIFPNILDYASKQFRYTILITGTNGKTTTQTLIANILKNSKTTFIANTSGSNMKRGIISAIINSSNLFGRIQAEVAVFEVEEATLPKIISALNPNQIIVTNLYRDQLDAYGEIDRTQTFIRKAIEMVPKAVAILNADDPRVALLTRGLPNQSMYFSIEKKFRTDFKYEGINTKELEINPTTAENILIKEDLSSEFEFSGERYHSQIPGVFHIYNSTAAIISAKLLQIPNEIIKKSLESSVSAFGRGEKITIEDVTYQILLIKNPAGATLTLQLLKHTKSPNLILLLNDNTADGKDVSWIWDANFEILKELKPKTIIVSGARANDMLLRIKYSLGELKQVSENEWEVFHTRIILVNEISKIPEIARNTKERKFFVLPTYTAMLEFRKTLTGEALVI